MPLAIEKFFLGHAMVSNKTPKAIKVEELHKLKEIKGTNLELESFGLFEVSAPDFNKFYPDVKPEDLIPKDDEFAYPIFRALSETRVNKYGPINFGVGGALKQALARLKGQAVYTNHEMVTGNEVGVVLEAFWEEAYTSNKIKIPAGINVRLKLDGKANPKLIRSIMMDPPAVHSVSVTVEFKWEPSHPALAREEFYNKLGTYDAEGKLIERVVTEVVSFHEISLVPHGADPYAQKVNEEGTINDPAYADRKARMKFSAEDFKAQGHYMDFKDVATFCLDETIPSNQITHNNTNQNSNSTQEAMNEQTLVFLREKFGLAKDAPESVVMAKFTAALTAETELATTKQTLSALQTKFPEGAEVLSAEAKAKLTELETVKTQLTARVAAEKAEALKLYHITVGGADKADPAIAKLIGEAAPETATALLMQYKKSAEEKFTASCQSCGSTNVKRTSNTSADGVLTPGTEGGQGGEQTHTVKSNAEVIQSLSVGKGSVSGIIHETKTNK